MTTETDDGSDDARPKDSPPFEANSSPSLPEAPPEVRIIEPDLKDRILEPFKKAIGKESFNDIMKIMGPLLTELETAKLKEDAFRSEITHRLIEIEHGMRIIHSNILMLGEIVTKGRLEGPKSPRTP